jgi:hypothetical protein
VTQRPMLLHATEPGQALKHSVGSLASGFIALDSGGDVGLRAALALTLLGPPAVAVGAPIASWLILRAVGLSLMGGVALVLHRFVARRYHTRAVR